MFGLRRSICLQLADQVCDGVLVKVCFILKRLTDLNAVWSASHQGLGESNAASLRRVRMAQLNFLLGELLATGMQLRSWTCVVLALAMRRLRQCSSIWRAWVSLALLLSCSRAVVLSFSLSLFLSFSLFLSLLLPHSCDVVSCPL